METLKEDAGAAPSAPPSSASESRAEFFHAPLIAAHPDYSLDVIVTADPVRAAEAARLLP